MKKSYLNLMHGLLLTTKLYSIMIQKLMPIRLFTQYNHANIWIYAI